VAQNAAEDRAARHEAELTAVRDTHAHAQLRRSCTCPTSQGGDARANRHEHNIHTLSSFARSPRRGGAVPLAPTLSPRFAPPRARLGDDTDDSDDEDGDAGAVMNLRSRVAELEALLHEAEAAMQEVIGKMSTAQIEVMMLRDEKEEAVRETRRLQKVLEGEAKVGFEDRFKSLAGLVR